MGNEPSRPPPPEEETPPPGDPSRPSDVRVEVDVDMVEDICNTNGFDSDDYLVVRRDVQFSVTVHAREKVHIQSVLLIDAYSERNTVTLRHVEGGSTRSGTEVQIVIPADAPVGEYVLQVTGRIVNGGEFQTTLRRRVVVLFNAWSRNDGVYMEDASGSREEYVRNTKGRVYAGSVYGMPWNLALYRENTLKAVLLLLRKAPQLSFEQRRSPVFVSREMSALVNVQDDAGVLIGNWSGNYEDGTSPSAWRGSAKILKQYLKSGGQPVRYGQCWVFSGVLLTVLRVLGIPSRSVTNFNSAHDTNRNRTIDEYYNEDGEKISYLSSGSDSIWNFHVWNEAWMTRPDLPAGFGGWQAVDATPQEESPQGGGYRTGPAPIKAVKEGNSVVYDTNFVIAEVNADIKKFSVGADGVPQLVSVDTQSVGRDISTKAVGSNRRVDLTNAYKHREGSDLERRALYHGYEELLKEVHDMTFDIPEATYSFGQDVKLQVNMFNKAKQHTVKGSIVCEAVDYTGKVLREVQKLKVDKKVNKGKTETVSMTVKGSIFSEYPGNKVYLRFTVYLAVHEAGQVFSKEVSIAPEPPTLEVIAPPKLTMGTTSKATVKFKNPLPVKMEKVVLTVEGDGLLREDIENVVGTIEAGAEFSFTFDLHGLLPGQQQLVAGLDSDKVEMVSGEAEVLVVEGVEETDSPWQPEVEVLSVDLNLSTNRRVHHTNRYSKQDLVLRRGQLFSISLQLAKPISAGKLVTRATFALLGDNYRRPYSFEVVTVSKATGTTLNIEMKTPADVPVGRYKVLLTVDNGGKVTVVDQDLRVILLFNPWNSEDTCYYSTTSDLAEYVLSNKGRIWVGNSDSNYGRPWQFAQFTPQALDVALYLLRVLPKRDRANPIKVSRHLSAMVNSQDDNGILVGNWSGDYSGGASPLKWTGSAEILAQFARTRKPVKYGQCWVFSGVLSTLLRCVGLPARSVTNFNSAHDTHFNRAIDKYFDEDGEELSSGDSIWNFHVWNEAWMARPDLPAGFGGWQAVDATPQEESPQGGGYRLGPCPVQAVKLGQRMNYDVEFVISEVNADIRYYTLRRGGDPFLTRVNRRHVGQYISTKAVGNNAVNDITNEYKFREGSMAERAALLADAEDKRELDVSISSNKNVLIGQPFTVVVTVTNKTGEVHDYRMNLRGRTMLYTGITGQVVKKLRENIRLEAGQSTTVEMRVRPFDYLKLLEGGNFMQFVAMVIADNDASAVDTYSLRLKTPDIDISLPADGLKLYHPATLEVSFRNPLDKVLYNGEFQLLGEGHVQDATVDIPPVPPQGIAKASITTIPVVAGAVELVVRFSSNRLSDIMGDVDTKVTK